MTPNWQYTQGERETNNKKPEGHLQYYDSYQ